MVDVPAQHPRSRLAALTGWRFVAAMAVVANHLADVFEPQWPSYLDDYVQAIGRIGVTFFFVLSGFVLTWSSSTRDGTARFYQRRIARIVPAYLVAWALGLGLVALAGSQPRLLTAVLGTFLLQAWHPDPAIHFGGNSVAWSLSIEMLFYALFPLILPLVTRVDRRGRLLAMAALVLASLGWAAINALAGNGATAWAVAILPVVRLPGFLSGVLLALHLRDGGSSPLSTSQAILVTGGATLLLPVVPGALRPEALVLVPFLLLLLAVAAADLAGRPSPLATPLAVRLGEWSFALYLVHQLVFRAVGLVVDLPGLTPPAALVLTVALTVAAIAAAAALYSVVERPAERWLRDIRRTRPTPALPGEPHAG